jgi:hypothetical protein
VPLHTYVLLWSVSPFVFFVTSLLPSVRFQNWLFDASVSVCFCCCLSPFSLFVCAPCNWFFGGRIMFGSCGCRDNRFLIAHRFFAYDDGDDVLKMFWLHCKKSWVNWSNLRLALKCDQIRRIFAQRVIVYVGYLFWKLHKRPSFWGHFVPRIRLCINFLKKCVGLQFVRFHHKLICDRWRLYSKQS